MTSSDVVVELPHEMERKIAILVQVATQFQSRIYLRYGTKRVNAKSIMGMMTLALNPNDNITVETDGPDENEAMEAISKFLRGQQ